jgi:alkylhydroperoxidase family enzyme
MPPGWPQFLPLPYTPPTDIHADSRSRLPLVQSRPRAASAPPPLYSRGLAPAGTGPGQIRRYGEGLESLERSVGPQLISLAKLVTARAYDAQYLWTMNELAARELGLEPAVIDTVRERRPTTGLAERDAILIEFARELFGAHTVRAQTYARALAIFGQRDLVDLIDMMAQQVGEATLLAAFDQQLPANQVPLLPRP